MSMSGGEDSTSSSSSESSEDNDDEEEVTDSKRIRTSAEGDDNVGAADEEDAFASPNNSMNESGYCSSPGSPNTMKQTPQVIKEKCTLEESLTLLKI